MLHIIIKTNVMTNFDHADDRQNSFTALMRRVHIALLFASTTVGSNYDSIHKSRGDILNPHQSFHNEYLCM